MANNLSAMKLTAAIDDELTPVRRPHYQLRDSSLYFLISRRPHITLDSTDIALWHSIDGRNSIHALRDHFPDLDNRIRNLWNNGTIELVPTTYQNGRKKILIIEPHMDDAILSIGGTMWKQRHLSEFTVLSVVGISNFTSYYRINRDYFDVDTVTELRRAESETAMRILGGHHRVLDVLDAPLRYHNGNWTREWYIAHRRSISAFINSSPPTSEIEILASKLCNEFRNSNAAEIWIPLGVGTSTDHEITRNACLQALIGSPQLAATTTLYFYQDVPYARQFPWHTRQIIDALRDTGCQTELCREDIRPVINDKLRLLEVFGSQFKSSYMAPKVIATAHLAAACAKRQAEIRYRIKTAPTHLDTFSLYSGREPVLSLYQQLRQWYTRYQSSPQIRILCPMGVGRWKESMTALLAAFPKATFEVHLSADAIAETGRLASPRIHICPVDPHPRAWILRILRLMASRTAPTIIFTSARARYLWPLARLLLFRVSPLLAATMDHFVLSLRDCLKKHER